MSDPQSSRPVDVRTLQWIRLKSDVTSRFVENISSSLELLVSVVSSDLASASSMPSPPEENKQNVERNILPTNVLFLSML